MKFPKRNILVLVSSLILAIILGLVVVLVLKKNLNKRNVEGVSASTSQALISSDAEWNVGTKSNISVSGGNISINDTTPVSELNLNSATLSGDPSSGVSNVIDGNTGTFWGPVNTNSLMSPPPPFANHITVDLGSDIEISSVQVNYSNCYSAGVWYSSDGSNWTSAGSDTGPSGPASYDTINVAPTQTKRYWRFSLSDQIAPFNTGKIYEIKMFTPGQATATHTSGSTQITDANLYQWNTFTPTYTKPANTNISFKFRTSQTGLDGSWTAWTASQTAASGAPFDISGLVTSKTGAPGSEVFYPYIQVESTLTSTDGVSTPTLSDYTIGYHTNVKPNQPTAQTAAIE